jgi:hypothetical protein
VGPGAQTNVFKGRSLRIDHRKLSAFLNFHAKTVPSSRENKAGEVQTTLEQTPSVGQTRRAEKAGDTTPDPSKIPKKPETSEESVKV